MSGDVGEFGTSAKGLVTLVECCRVVPTGLVMVMLLPARGRVVVARDRSVPNFQGLETSAYRRYECIWGLAGEICGLDGTPVALRPQGRDADCPDGEWVAGPFENVWPRHPWIRLD